jgi:hypothetical protein
MASGHVYRANRPNTWLHRPTLQREDSSCQPGAVHTWPKADLVAASVDVRFCGQSRLFGFHNIRSAHTMSAVQTAEDITITKRQVSF